LEKNKAIVRRLTEEENKRNLAILDELIAPDYVHHTQKWRGREEYKQYTTMLFNAFPDWHEDIEDIIAEGDRVWVCFKFTGTHTGEFRGLAPAGKKITLEAVLIYRIVNGKVVEMRGVYDALDFYKQLGVIEYTEKGKKLFP